jgi:hypothetical protein
MAVPPIVAFQFKMMVPSYSGTRCPSRESQWKSEGSRGRRADASKSWRNCSGAKPKITRWVPATARVRPSEALVPRMRRSAERRAATPGPIRLRCEWVPALRSGTGRHFAVADALAVESAEAGRDDDRRSQHHQDFGHVAEHETAKIRRRVPRAVLPQCDNCVIGGVLAFGRLGLLRCVQSSGKRSARGPSNEALLPFAVLFPRCHRAGPPLDGGGGANRCHAAGRQEDARGEEEARSQGGSPPTQRCG